MAPEDPLLQRWVETWIRAGVELERIRREEIGSLDTRQAIQQIFGHGSIPIAPPAPTTSGLVEQQAWFRRLREAQLQA